MEPQIHLHPTAPLAERVLLPGDPGRALRLAQALLDEPKMFNHNRGLWGYTAPARVDGQPLTIQSTGMGGPSIAIVVNELVNLGARRLVRVGTCGGLDARLALGQLLIAPEAISDDGTSRALGTADRAPATPALLSALRAAGCGAVTEGPVVSTDLFYDATDRHQSWRAAGALAVEMEAATLFTLAARRGVEAACALLVSDLLSGGPVRIDSDELHEAELRLGELAARALRLDGQRPAG
jgi:DeoD family purine-nucleoside phosphorylase